MMQDVNFKSLLKDCKNIVSLVLLDNVEPNQTQQHRILMI